MSGKQGKTAARNVPGLPIPADYAEAKGNTLEAGLPSRQVLGQRDQSMAPGSQDDFGTGSFAMAQGGKGARTPRREELLRDDARAARRPVRDGGMLPGQAAPEH